MSLLTKIFGDPNKRAVARYLPQVEKINGLEAEFEKLSDADLKQKTAEFKERLKKDESLDEILPEAFALVREAAWRTIRSAQPSPS